MSRKAPAIRVTTDNQISGNSLSETSKEDTDRPNMTFSMMQDTSIDQNFSRATTSGRNVQRCDDHKRNCSATTKSKRKPVYKVVQSRYKSKPNTTKRSAVPPQSQQALGLNITPVSNKLEEGEDLDAKASTPTAHQKSLFKADMSAIYRPSASAAASSAAKHAAQPSCPVKITQDDLHLAFYEYCRMAYVNKMVKNAAEKRQSEAVKDLTNMGLFLSKLREEVGIYEEEVEVLQSYESLKDIVEKGEEDMKLVHTEDFYEKMSDLTVNIDAVRHGLETRNLSRVDSSQLYSALGHTEMQLNDTSHVYNSLENCESSCMNDAELKSKFCSTVSNLESVSNQCSTFHDVVVVENKLRLQLDTEKMFEETV
ncbi:unnamed protein product [Clavelina lepadiformis]|uniref:HAUS augmin-like complex subunit 8 n=1 Tax=Clavelina lepadiformis TaxID=159417 RepID=A0ABP0G9T7_CLALP